MALFNLFSPAPTEEEKKAAGWHGGLLTPHEGLFNLGLGILLGEPGMAMQGWQSGLQNMQNRQFRNKGTEDLTAAIQGNGARGGAVAAPNMLPSAGGASAPAGAPAQVSPALRNAAAAGRIPGDDARATYAGLIQQGWSPVQAAALAGNIQQESNFNTNAFNPKEDAHGQIQWRGPRWQALQDYARKRGTSPDDRDTQLRFIRQEFETTESGPGKAFMAATDLDSANQALKSYIRYGDDSYGTRLRNAQTILGANAGAAPGAAPADTFTPALNATVGNMAPDVARRWAGLLMNPATREVAWPLFQQMLKGPEAPTIQGGYDQSGRETNYQWVGGRWIPFGGSKAPPARDPVKWEEKTRWNADTGRQEKVMVNPVTLEERPFGGQEAAKPTEWRIETRNNPQTRLEERVWVNPITQEERPFGGPKPPEQLVKEQDGEIVRIDPDNGKVLWRVPKTERDDWQAVTVNDQGWWVNKTTREALPFTEKPEPGITNMLQNGDIVSLREGKEVGRIKGSPKPASYRMTPEEIQQAGLEPSLPWYMGTNGVPALPQGYSPTLEGSTAAQVALMQTTLKNFPKVVERLAKPWDQREAFNFMAGAGPMGEARRIVTMGIEGALRALTGASALPSEVERLETLFMPGQTDTAQTRALKLNALKDYMNHALGAVSRGRGNLAPQDAVRQAEELLNERMNPDQPRKEKPKAQLDINTLTPEKRQQLEVAQTFLRQGRSPEYIKKWLERNKIDPGFLGGE